TGTPIYNWSNGATSGTINNLAAGTYTCTVTDGSGCTAVKSVTVNSPTLLEGFTSAQNANCGLNDGAAYLSINGGTAPYTILWSNGSTTANISGLAPGNYTVTVTDANGCTFSSSTSVGTNGGSAPATPGTITGSKYSVCPGLSKAYSCSAVSGATNYIWTAPANATITNGQGTTNITISYLAGFTSGNITVQAQSSCGTSSAKSATVKSVPGLPKSIVGGVKNLCNSVVNYSVPASTTGGTSHTWYVPASATILNGQGTTSINVQWSNTSVTGASICVEATNACGASPLRCLNGLTTNPSRPALISGPTSVCANQTNISYSVVSEPGVNYTWTVPAGASVVSGQGTSAVSINWATTTGLLGVTASNPCGSAQKRSMTVSVVCRLSDVQANNVQLLPNPSSGKATLNLGVDPGNYQVTISDILGREILRKNGSNDQFEIDLLNRAKGLYLVAVRFDDGTQKVVRMIVE
ncbi:MAG: T9SS type A sorting domain-containing protein, partial [Bacteroidia bacterium]